MRHLLLTCIALATAVMLYGQTPLEGAIRTQNFTFRPSFIVGMLGQKKPIAGAERYFLRVTPDSIVCYLPTPKRRYKQGAIPFKNGKPDFSRISYEERFALRGYTFSVKEEAKGETQLQIVPKAKGRIQQVRINVLPDGGATLAIGTTEYEPIIYAGTMTPDKALRRKKR